MASRSHPSDFWRRCEPTDDGCLVWTGCLTAQGYGTLQYHGRKWLAHRLAYWLTVEPIEDGAKLLHLCENRACVRPDHLQRPCEKAQEAAPSRFWSKVDQSGDCWFWLGHKDSKGYGQIKVEGAWVRAHRYAFLAAGEQIPDGWHLHHECRNPGCVNPAHLTPISPGAHSRLHPAIIGNRNREATACKRGHSFDEANTRRRVTPYGFGRACRICACEAAKRSKERRKANV